MTSSISRRKPRQRQRLASPSTSVHPRLGDFSKILEVLDSHRASTTPQVQEPTLASEPTSTTQNASSRPRPLDISETGFTDIMAPEKKNYAKAEAVAKPQAENSTKAIQATSPTPEVFDTTSDDSDLEVSCLGDFDPVEPDLDLNGGADLSDITTPPTSPLIQAATPFAADRLFEKNTSARAYVLSDQTLVSRIINDFEIHDTQLRQNQPELLQEGVHVLIDASNITVAFYELLKQRLGLPKHKRLPPCISFSTLRDILERERTVAKRIIAGSKNPDYTYRPKYFDDAEEAGYRTLVKNRVTLPKNGRNQRPYHDSSYDECDSSSERNRYQSEEGVDEIVQMQMLYSLRNKPGIMALVTGDGNSNESGFSEGFPATVKAALQDGWVVEVYAFRNSCAGIWTSAELLSNGRWAGRYSVHHLDAYANDLCNPAYIPKLEALAAANTPRFRARCLQTTNQRKALCIPHEKELCSEFTSITKAEKTWTVEVSVLEDSRRTPSTQKAKSSESTQSASFCDIISGYQRKLQTSSTSSAFDTFGTTRTSSTNAVLGGACPRLGSGITGGALGYQNSNLPSAIHI